MLKQTLMASVGLLALSLTAGSAIAQHDHAQHGTVDQLGKVNFANSCKPEVQGELGQGVALLHSFWYNLGETTFRKVLEHDPSCAVATWGIASLIMSNPLAGVGPTAEDAKRAQAAIDEGQRIGAKTQREQDYIEAVAAYYKDFAARPERDRQKTRSDAYVALAAKYPDDDEAQIFNALYLAGTQSQADQTFAAYHKSAAILEPMFVKYPQHPGVAHYLIHVYDAPSLAQDGLPAARKYSEIAPDAPHALHMPSHIFTRVGDWEHSDATNRRSFKVAVPAGDNPEAYHASDYAVYADLQLGRDAAAAQLMMDALKVPTAGPGAAIALYAAGAMPARYALERADWEAASKLKPPSEGALWTRAATWFARGVGGARSGDDGTAHEAADELAKLHSGLVRDGNTYWAREVEVQQLTVAAWIALAHQQTGEALASMQKAATMEDGSEKHIVTPGRMLPARELLGDMLLQAGKPTEALKEYEASQLREPNRLRGFYGAARAAEAAGNREKAFEYYKKLLALTKDADSNRAEITKARAFTSG